LTLSTAAWRSSSFSGVINGWSDLSRFSCKTNLQTLLKHELVCFVTSGHAISKKISETDCWLVVDVLRQIKETFYWSVLV
jgi:hypothetical protein